MGDYLKQILEFTWAVINNWAGYATGGLVVAIVWLWSTLKQIPVSRKIGIALALVFLFFAVFNAWREQYLKTHPGLSFHFGQVGTGFGTVGPTGAAKIFIIASVSNVGSPSIADGWRLTIKPPDKSEVAHEASFILPDHPITFAGDFGTIEYSQDEALYNKTINQPIPTGGKVAGILIFDFPEFTKDVVDKKGTVFTITFRDVSDNILSAEYLLRGVSERSQYMPGIKPPNYKPNK